jgi:hypothetical protein
MARSTHGSTYTSTHDEISTYTEREEALRESYVVGHDGELVHVSELEAVVGLLWHMEIASSRVRDYDPIGSEDRDGCYVHGSGRSTTPRRAARA